jgi:hypothetical protein
MLLDGLVVEAAGIEPAEVHARRGFKKNADQMLTICTES